MTTIFFVHDAQEDPEVRATALRNAGYLVSLFTGESEIIDRLQKELPSLILMDVLLEGPNGFAACRRIRGLLDATQMPIVLGSHVYRSRIYRDEAQAAGAQRYLRYPMDLDEMIDVVHEVIAEAARGQRAA